MTHAGGSFSSTGCSRAGASPALHTSFMSVPLWSCGWRGLERGRHVMLASWGGRSRSTSMKVRRACPTTSSCAGAWRSGGVRCVTRMTGPASLKDDGCGQRTSVWMSHATISLFLFVLTPRVVGDLAAKPITAMLNACPRTTSAPTIATLTPTIAALTLPAPGAPNCSRSSMCPRPRPRAHHLVAFRGLLCAVVDQGSVEPLQRT